MSTEHEERRMNKRRTKKILMVERSDIYHDARVQKEANSLIKANYKVCVLGLRESKENIDCGFLFDLTSFRLLSRKYGLFRKAHLIFLILLINYLILFRKADFYHAHNTMFLFGMFVAAKIHKGKFIYDSHEVQWQKTKIESWLEKIFIKRVDHIINVSEGRANLQAERYSVEKEKITIISNYPVLSNEVKPNFRNKNEKIRFIYSGGFHLSTNRIDNFVKAITKYPNLYFDLMAFGYANDGEKLFNLIKYLGVEKRVKFIPLVSPEKVVSTISQYDFAVNMLINPQNLVSLNYPSINKIYEYMSAGLPLFCSNLPAFEEEIISTGIGLSVNPLSIDSIETGLEQIIEMPNDEFLSMKEKAFSLAKDSYNWSTQENKLRALYYNLSRGNNKNYDVV